MQCHSQHHATRRLVLDSNMQLTRFLLISLMHTHISGPQSQVSRLGSKRLAIP
jgi:hypothetical protein